MRLKQPIAVETIDIIRLIRSENVGPRTFYAMLKVFGSASVALEQAADFSLRGGRTSPIKLASKDAVEAELERLSDYGAGVLTYLDADYPQLLLSIYDPPPVLNYLGDAKLLNKNICSIVGARNASINGCNFAASLAKELVNQNIVIASGLARGVDTAAHISALPQTIAVIAGGIDHIYPPENTALFKNIAELGVILAELPIGSVPLGQHFPQRNRIISGLSKVTAVIEASLKSGSLITARYALEQGREVCAVPGFPLDPRCQGSNRLLKQGANLLESAEDIIALLQQNYSGRSLEDSGVNNFQDQELNYSNVTISQADRNKVKNFLAATPTTIEVLHMHTELSFPILYTILLELELAAKVQRHPGNKFSQIY